MPHAVSEDTLKRFAAGTASAEENRAVVAHLLKGCGVCARSLRSVMDPELLKPEEEVVEAGRPRRGAPTDPLEPGGPLRKPRSCP